MQFPVPSEPGSAAPVLPVPCSVLAAGAPALWVCWARCDGVAGGEGHSPATCFPVELPS